MKKTAAARIESWIWVLVYAGIVTIGLGVTARRSDASTGSVIALIGALLLAGGIMLIWIRSRLRTDPTPPPNKPPTP